MPVGVNFLVDPKGRANIVSPHCHSFEVAGLRPLPVAATSHCESKKRRLHVSVVFRRCSVPFEEDAVCDVWCLWN